MPVHVLRLAALPVIGGALLLAAAGVSSAEPAIRPPQTITVAAGNFSYREAGEFYRDNYAVDGPMVERRMPKFTITKYQISAADYDRCADEGACPAREPKAARGERIPATGVSFDDASAYARWLSLQTGQEWRLPTDEELAFAAGDRYPDDALGVEGDVTRNPALRWLADYERETARKESRDPAPQPFGSFGESASGLTDFGGNVWEWTTTCLRRVNLDAQGRTVSTDDSCGIYIATGKHRASLSSFVREPKNGGCSVGVPPDNVGFRLVRESRWSSPVIFAIRRLTM